MKLKVLLTAIVTVLLSSATAHAQKVETEVGKAIINCTGLPEVAITSVKKPVSTTGTNTAAAGKGADDIASILCAKTVYRRFQVHATDNASNVTWKGAIDLCASLTKDGGGWRLPTQRDMMLIWILHAELSSLEKTIFTAFGTLNYWCATEEYVTNPTRCFYLLVRDRVFSKMVKTELFAVRCVKDL